MIPPFGAHPADGLRVAEGARLPGGFMKAWRLSIAAAALLAAWLVAETRSDEIEAPPGKKIFQQYKCHSCHSIQAQGIEKKKIAGEEATGTSKPQDLSNVGKKHDAAWISKFLLKQETLEGKRHRKKFRGSESELKVLSTWLESLKRSEGGKKK
jgi:mono/diheme cytochrome c family protein